jgi:hypothetical protein
MRWQELERQVEQLGFGDLFFVSATKGKRGEYCKIDPAMAIRCEAGSGWRGEGRI